MKAIILAAGRGKRLKPLTNNIPKTLIKVNGKTILERLIETLKECGVDDILVVAGYLADEVSNVVQNYNGVNLLYNNEYSYTDNMYSLMLCRDKCINESILILNGDLIVNKNIIRNSLNCGCSNMPIDRNTALKDGQKVIIEDNRITRISKQLLFAHGTAINIVYFSVEDATIYFENIEKIIKYEKRTNEWWEIALDDILDKVNVKSIEINNNFWIEIDDYNDLERANSQLKNI